MTDKCKDCRKELTTFEQATANLHKGQPMAGMCGACKFKYTEEKHGTAQAELDQIRAKARQRNWRFMEKKKSEGGRQLSAIVTKECYDTLTRIRDNAQQAGTPQSFGAIIEKALTVYVSTLDQSKQGDSTSDTTNVCSNDRINKAEIEPDAKPVEHQTEIPAPDQEPETASGVDLSTIPKHGTPEYRKWLFEYMDEQRKSKVEWAEIADQLNTQGLKPLRSEKFNKTNAGIFYSRILKELAKKS